MYSIRGPRQDGLRMCGFRFLQTHAGACSIHTKFCEPSLFDTAITPGTNNLNYVLTLLFVSRNAQGQNLNIIQNVLDCRGAVSRYIPKTWGNGWEALGFMANSKWFGFTNSIHAIRSPRYFLLSGVRLRDSRLCEVDFGVDIRFLLGLARTVKFEFGLDLFRTPGVIPAKGPPGPLKSPKNRRLPPARKACIKNPSANYRDMSAFGFGCRCNGGPPGPLPWKETNHRLCGAETTKPLCHRSGWADFWEIKVINQALIFGRFPPSVKT